MWNSWKKISDDVYLRDRVEDDGRNQLATFSSLVLTLVILWVGRGHWDGVIGFLGIYGVVVASSIIFSIIFGTMPPRGEYHLKNSSVDGEVLTPKANFRKKHILGVFLVSVFVAGALTFLATAIS